MARVSTRINPGTGPLIDPRALRLIAWWLLLAIVLAFLWATYRKYGHPDPASYTMFWPRRGWLWAHLAGGALTLLLGPFQFIARLRTARPRLHRWSGRLYLVALLLTCVGTAGLLATTQAGPGIRIAFACTGVAWLYSAAMAYAAIRARRIGAHRRWMIRNYIITCVFMTFRVATLVPGVMALGPPQVMVPTLVWLSWLVPLAAYEAGAAVADRRRPTRARIRGGAAGAPSPAFEGDRRSG